MEDGRWLIDGGIATNNPSLLGYVEAKKIFSSNNIKVLGIGAGLNKRKISGKIQGIGELLDGLGMIFWE